MKAELALTRQNLKHSIEERRRRQADLAGPPNGQSATQFLLGKACHKRVRFMELLELIDGPLRQRLEALGRDKQVRGLTEKRQSFSCFQDLRHPKHFSGLPSCPGHQGRS